MTAYFQKFADWIGWSSLSVLIGLIALFFTIDFKKTEVRMFILSDTNLVDVKSPLSDLQILYNGKDLIKEHLNLHLYRIQVQNTGSTILRKEDFDDNDLWGIHVSAGNIVKIGEPDSESSYISKNLVIRTPDQMTLLFTPIIFEPGDSFVIDFFVLLTTSTGTSSVTSVGKIAGIKRIPVTVLNLNRRSLFYEAYLGDWEVLALRVLAAPVYIILFGLAIWGIIGPAFFVRSRFRRRQISRALTKSGIGLADPAVIAIRELVGSSGRDGIVNIIFRINSILTKNSGADSKKVNVSDEAVQKTTISEETIGQLRRGRILVERENRELVINNDPDEMMPPHLIVQAKAARSDEDYMLENGILSKADDEWKVNTTALQALTVLAKAFDTKAPNTGSSEVERVNAGDTSTANGEEVQPHSA
jgi:hypothetical protein